MCNRTEIDQSRQLSPLKGSPRRGGIMLVMTIFKFTDGLVIKDMICVDNNGYMVTNVQCENKWTTNCHDDFLSPIFSHTHCQLEEKIFMPVSSMQFHFLLDLQFTPCTNKKPKTVAYTELHISMEKKSCQIILITKTNKHLTLTDTASHQDVHRSLAQLQVLRQQQCLHKSIHDHRLTWKYQHQVH